MFALQRVVRSGPKLMNLSETQRRTMLGTPPRTRISLAEKIVIGAVFWLGVMGTPMYIACNINSYNAGQSEE